MNRCQDKISLVQLSTRLLGWNDEDFVVVEVDYTHALARLIDVRTGASTIYSFRDLGQLIGEGDLKIAARQQSITPAILRFSNKLDRRAFYCKRSMLLTRAFCSVSPKSSESSNTRLLKLANNLRRLQPS